MTGHHHAPFTDGDSPPFAKASGDKRAHLHMWIAVGVIMAAIVGFWLVLLPSQFGGRGFFGDEAARLRAIGEADIGAPLQESMQRMRAELDAMSQTLQEDAAAQQAAAASASMTADESEYAAEIQRLQERLDAATTEETPSQQ